MKYEVLKKIEYKKDFRIYIMHFDYVFQYFITDKKKNLFQDFVILKPNLWNIFKYKIGITKSPYPEEQFKVCEEIILSGAVKTIDQIIKGDKVIEDEREELRKEAKQRGITECNWRVLKMDDEEAVYQCLTHPEFIVPMVENEAPFHERDGRKAVLSPFVVK